MKDVLYQKKNEWKMYKLYSKMIEIFRGIFIK
jgi:hypothetical protein